MFSHGNNGSALPSAEKKSFISRLRPLFQRSKRITPNTPRGAYPIVQQPDTAFPSSALHQFAPSLPSSPQIPLVVREPRTRERSYHAVVPTRECSTPGVPMYSASEFPFTPTVIPPTFPIVQQGVYSVPYMGSPPTFLPITPPSGSVGSPAGGAAYPPVSPGLPGRPEIPAAAVRPQTASRQSASRNGMSSREHRANSSSTRISRQSRLSLQVPPFGLQSIPSVSTNTVTEPSSYLAVQESTRRHNSTHSVDYDVMYGRHNEQHRQIWQGPRKQRFKPPSAEYLATPLSDNPLGLIGMVPGKNYDKPQDTDVAPRHHRISRQHTASRYAPSSAVPDLTAPQASSQNAGQRRERDAYFVHHQHLENTRSSRRDTSRASQEYTLSYDRHLPAARSRSVTAEPLPYQATTPRSRTYPGAIVRPN